jgi:hypothetical protein
MPKPRASEHAVIRHDTASRRPPTPQEYRRGRRLYLLSFLAMLALLGVSIHHYYTTHVTAHFNVVLAVLAAAYRINGQLLLRASFLMGRDVSWKHLHWPWILRTAFAWSLAVLMAGYIHYTVKAYKYVLSWVPARGIDHLRADLHVNWLALTLGVILWALWLTVALEVLRLFFLHVLGVSIDQDAQSAPGSLPNFLAVRISRGEDGYQIALTLWFLTFGFTYGAG